METGREEEDNVLSVKDQWAPEAGTSVKNTLMQTPLTLSYLRLGSFVSQVALPLMDSITGRHFEEPQ